VALRANAWKVVLGVGACLIAVYSALPDATDQDYLYSFLGMASVVGILVGVRLQRPRERLGWYLLAAAGACFTMGDDIWDVYSLVLHRPVPFPSVADLLYLAGYPFLVGGLLRVTAGAGRSSKREDSADAAIIAMGALAVSWHFLMNSYVHESLSVVGKLVTLAYPVMDIALLYILVRTLLFGSGKRPFHTILSAAILSMCVADFTYDLLVLHNGYTTGNIVDALYLAEYVLIAVAALHPSVAVAPDSAPPETALASHSASGEAETARQAFERNRIPLVVMAGFIPPVILVMAAVFHMGVNVPVLALLCIAVFATVCLRLSWLIERIKDQSRQMEASQSNLRHMAFHDELTGLANRALLNDRLEHALDSATRTGRTVALLLGDLDGFKTINDTLGHHVGDRVLVKTGAVLQSILRPGDTVARLGGDEFAVLVEDVPRPEDAVEFARRIVSVLHDAVEFEGEQAGMSISVGVAFASASTSVERLLSEADAAMYEAKANGKNRVEVFQSSMRARLVERLEIISAFRGSLERTEFYLCYQPIFSLEDGTLRGFETLVRWQHPARGQISPDEFIPMAEETGFIIQLGRWIFLEACMQMASWAPLMDRPLSITVNLSRIQLALPSVVDDLSDALRLSGIQPEQVVLEITEGGLMEHPELAASALATLRGLGVRVAVDDFGTGYSSLSHLQRFPVDVLKVDKSFVAPLGVSEPESTALVTSIIGLAHSLGLNVVAEGIETEDQLDRLRSLGCDYGQGYLMARPLLPPQVEDLMIAGQPVNILS
jgi:diguanylate cyclase (GGDEF)-like protein